MRQKVPYRIETIAYGGNCGCEFHLSVLSCIFTVVSTAAAESQTSRFPRFSPQSHFKLNTQKACPEKMLLPGVSSLKGACPEKMSQPFLKYLVNILRNRFLFSGDIIQYILLLLVARQPQKI